MCRALAPPPFSLHTLHAPAHVLVVTHSHPLPTLLNCVGVHAPAPCPYSPIPTSTPHTPHPSWLQALEAAGLTAVVATNVTPLFVECLEIEAAKLEAVKDSFVAEFSLEDFDYLMGGWKAKMVRCAAGLQTWGLFQATKAPVA